MVHSINFNNITVIDNEKSLNNTSDNKVSNALNYSFDSFINVKNKKKFYHNDVDFNINNNKIIKNNIEFPQGKTYKCIGPCFPANTLYYHPFTLQAMKSKKNTCPIKEQQIKNKKKLRDTCELDENYDYENYDVFSDVVQIAISEKKFLEQIYNIKNIYDAELFISNDVKELPNITQRRILNCIYIVYRDNDNFPNQNYLKLIKEHIKKTHDLKIKRKKLLTIIMDNKYKQLWKNIFDDIIIIK